MKVPLLDLQPQTDFFRDQIIKEITEVVDSTRYILGPKVTQLEQEVAEYSGAAAAVGVSSGTDALVASLMALELHPGDQVLTTPYTFFATAGAVHRVGARPVFVDIDPVTYNMEPMRVREALEQMAGEERRAVRGIIPVHLYGQCAEMAPILDLAVENNIVDKSGAWYSYNGERIGQGRENAKAFLKDHEDVVLEIENKVRMGYGLPVRDAAPAPETAKVD